MTRAVLSLALLLVTGLSAVGCTKTRAQFPEQQPTLIVPPVPPRVIEPAPVVTPPAEPPPVEPPPPPPPANKPSRPRPQPEVKPDPKETPPEVVSTPAPAPVAPLRSATAPTGPEATRQIRDIIDATQKMLDKVDYPNQSDDRKANYTTAKAYIQQAEEAMKKDELTQARSFAERAQNIAKVLTGR